MIDNELLDSIERDIFACAHRCYYYPISRRPRLKRCTNCHKILSESELKGSRYTSTNEYRKRYGNPQ